MGARIILLVSAFSPLILLIGVRVDSWSTTWVLWAIGLLAAAALPLLLALASRVSQPIPIHVRSIRVATDEISGYLATYLLPFVTLGPGNIWDLMAYVLFAVFLGAAYLQSNRLAVNPWLVFFRLRIYEVSTNFGNDLVIARQSLSTGDEPIGVRLTAGLYYVRKR